MDTQDVYTFKVEGLTPGTIPMARLAKYLEELARLLGEPERVHFKAIKKGSLVLTAVVERNAVPKVRSRVTQARAHDAPDDIRRPFKRINDLLRDDNASGAMSVGEGARILDFPGRKQAQGETFGPFTEPTEIDGQLVRIGGRDSTAHAQLQDSAGNVWSCEMNRELARQLGVHLYGVPLRVSGSGRWQRNPDGEWELLSFHAKDFRELRDDELPVLVERLRAVPGAAWRQERDPLGQLARVRGADEGVH